MRPGARVQTRLRISDESDLVVIRRWTRELAAQQGFTEPDTEALALAATEIARNIVVHAGGGEIAIGTLDEEHRQGVIVVARDAGPGISEIKQAMQDGFSTAQSLGFGLPSARRLVDEFDIQSAVGVGTQVILVKWTSTEPR
jgi:serine/threonine-protein kinase RsbT